MLLMLLFGIILLIGLPDVTAVAPKEYDPKPLVDGFNEARIKFAKENNISNMHELILSNDENFKNFFNKLKWNKTNFENSKGFRWSLAKENKGIEFFQHMTTQFLNMNGTEKKAVINNYYSTSLGFWEYLVPHQLRVGCARKEGVPTDFPILCLFVPEESINDKSFVTGVPASKCLEGYIPNDGLCSKESKKAPTILPENQTVTSSASKPSENKITLGEEVVIPFNDDATSVSIEDHTSTPSEVIVFESSTFSETAVQSSPEPVVLQNHDEQNVKKIPEDDQKFDDDNKLKNKNKESSSHLKPTPQTEQSSPVTTDKPASTTMSEVDKLIGKWRETETDGDDYDEDDRTTTETSEASALKLLISFMIFVAFFFH